MGIMLGAYAALQWRRSRNEKAVAVPALVMQHASYGQIPDRYKQHSQQDQGPSHEEWQPNWYIV